METTIFIITHKSFEQLYLDHWEKLFFFCVKACQDEDVAKEIVQDVFKSLWERRDSLQLKEVERYLVRSVKLKSFEHIRNKVTRQQHHEQIQNSLQEDYQDNHIETQELSSKINQLISALPNQCKNVFQMSRQEGLTNREIATRLYISERAVEYHITRALTTLKTHLADYIK
ncbi:RNA polymerase sigma-70 factor [Sphingobacterium sp. SYP-B4668]|uniref:RNA polymerase sigma-70 factor n=1 Tax=Sphingobacterium sp. SYP-B4668 TaxID=2996035 RepID=UPI000ADBFE7D|nr:RNA polymerase sigma-70 factor [Sphingobacterium sp. SYP-B4668]